MLTYLIRHAGGFVFGSALVFLGLVVWMLPAVMFGVTAPGWLLLVVAPLMLIGLLLIVFAAIKWLWSAA